MRLLNLTNRYYIVIALVLLLVSSAFLAYRVLYLIDREISDNMLIEKQEVEKQLALQDDIQDLHFIIGDRLEIEPIEKFTSFKVSMRDTVSYDLYQKEDIPYRVLSYEQLINGKSYRITLSHRLAGQFNIWEGVATTFGLVAIDIIICFYFLNRWFSNKVWQPFYRALNILKSFDIQKGGSPRFQRSKVEEFNAMNTELAKLTDKVSRDYHNLKEFTENMSHETQTPLAIIRSKLELLLQSENLTEEQVQHILSTLESVNRLSKMNKGLIMLTRIDNDQYANLRWLSLGNLIEKQLKQLDLFISSRELQLHIAIDHNVMAKMNPDLAEILISNLLSNAIKYNYPEGGLYVTLTTNKLVIANNGGPLSIPGDEVFDRFKKGDSPDSVGLGLAIVKRIVDHSDGSISYAYINQLHTFTILLPFATLDSEQSVMEHA